MKYFYSQLIKRNFYLLLSILLLSSYVFCQEQKSIEDKCTSIVVGKAASTDGSVMTSHSCDGTFYRTWLNIEPHKKINPGVMRKIYSGTLHTEFPGDMRNVKVKGEIPEVEETYSYVNTGYPFLNEKQLAMGETTIGGRRELENQDGMFLIEELQKIALERCKTAREAIKLMGQLAEKYGYGDAGECLTVIDANEAWYFEIYGAGVEEIGAVWAAVRIPDDQVGVSANIPRISTLDLSKPDYYMASPNVISLATKMGFFDPKKGEPFKFWKAYSGKKPFSNREYYILSTLAPSLKLTMDMEELPFSVKPEKKVSPMDVINYFKQTYTGHEFDALKNLLVPKGRNSTEKVVSGAVSPWLSGDLITLLNELKPGTVNKPRQIAINGCCYSHIIQCRSWLPDEIGGVAYFSFDNPGLSPRIPIYASTLSLPGSFAICGNKRYRADAAVWSFRVANRLATTKWGLGKPVIEKAIKEFEDKIFTDQPMIEKMAVELYNKKEKNADGIDTYKEYLTNYTNNYARAAMQKWVELGDAFWYRFGLNGF